MASRDDFFGEFYTETMTEMAENFFSRRREVEARLEGFYRLAEEVRSTAANALRHWRTFFLLLVDAEGAQEFLCQAGADVAGLPAMAAAGEPWRFHPPFALTGKGRYRKSVSYVYLAAMEATRNYLEGSYGRDPRNPMKMRLLPNYATLNALAVTINKEVEAVNTGQTPTAVLCYAKSLDASEQTREAVTGGMMGEDVCKLDRDMAFKPIDFAALNLPLLQLPKPLDEVEDALDALADSVYKIRTEEAIKALAFVKSTPV